MKKITKDNKGITLIVLIITIIIMLILVSVTTYTGLNTYKTVKVEKFVTQMQLFQSKVDNLVNTMSAEELEELDLTTPTTEQQGAITSAFENGEVTSKETGSYKVFTPDKIQELFEVEEVDNAIMVNFSTREIVDLYGVEYEGKTYYTQYKLPNGQMIVNDSNTPERNLEFSLNINVDGINANVIAKEIKITNGTLSYKKNADTNWKSITNYTQTDKEYTVLISESGEYTFKLQDNTSNEKEKEVTVTVKLTNKPQTDIEIDAYNYSGDSDKWAYAQNGDSTYVWIPRFVHKTNSDASDAEIKFIKGNSNIATDNTYINEGEWTLPDKFKDSNGTQLTGIWVKVDSKNTTGLDMIKLLSDSSATTLAEINE